MVLCLVSVVMLAKVEATGAILESWQPLLVTRFLRAAKSALECGQPCRWNNDRPAGRAGHAVSRFQIKIMVTTDRLP